jgi:hypothetical protein
MILIQKKEMLILTQTANMIFQVNLIKTSKQIKIQVNFYSLINFSF